MNAIEDLRRLPLEIEPPRGVRERTRQHLLASLSAPPAPLTVSDVAPRPAPPTLLAQHAGAKLAFLTLGSGIIGATLAVCVPMLNHHGHGTKEQKASVQAPLLPTQTLMVTTEANGDKVADTAQAQALPPVEPARASPAPTPPKSASRSHQTATSLALERALLDAAREELSRENAARAFELTETHLTRFAAGKLAEEREALAIAALAKMGERERAHRRAAGFKASYPASFFTKSVTASLGEPP